MIDILRFLEAAEIWIYGLLGLVGLFYLRKFLLAIAEWRGATFGLERDNAQRRLSESTGFLALVILMAIGEFLVVTFVSPTYPGVESLATPTLDVLATPTTTLSVAMVESGDGILSTTATVPPSGPSIGTGCISDQVNFTHPKPDDEVQGKVILKGVIQVPDYGYYKYEFTLRDEENWITIAAGSGITSTPEPDGSELGEWDTSTLTPGDYFLRLVVTDHQGQELPACVVPIRVVPPS